MSFGFAFLSYTNSVLESGINIVIDETKLETYIADADIVITGEGRLDGQTVMGKAPIGVAGIAKKYQKPIIAYVPKATVQAAIGSVPLAAGLSCAKIHCCM